MILGKLQKEGRCAICNGKLLPGETVYFNPSKTQGNHLAHPGCWLSLVEYRKAQGIPMPKNDNKKRSSETLDPPFA